MKEKKVFIANEDTVVFACPECDHSKRVDVSEYKRNVNTTRVENVCGNCGHVYTVILERRKFYRKYTRLAGKFIHEGLEWKMEVIDLSMTGMKFSTKRLDELNIGDRLVVVFVLDDETKTVITRKGVIREIFGDSVGLEFRGEYKGDDPLKRYLFT
jgi:predicted RNA-binding Zn-ribbon protein involved in translation (DUF1610 family)